MNEITQIYQSINAVSRRLNDVQSRLDACFTMLNKLTEEKVSDNAGAIEEEASIISDHDEAIADLAEIISEMQEG